MFKFEGWPGGPEGFGRAASLLADQFKALANGADGAAILAGDLINGHVLHAVEAEDREQGGRFAAALAFEAGEEGEGGTGDSEIGNLGRLAGGSCVGLTGD